MIFIKVLLFFILGIMFYEWIFPLIDSFIQLLGVHLEERKTKVAVRIKKLQSELEEPEEKPYCIGFHVNDDDEDEEEEDEE